MKTPIKAIRAKCLDCSAGHDDEVRNCHITGCPIHPYRMGKRPVVEGKPKKVMSPEHLAKLQAARLKNQIDIE